MHSGTPNGAPLPQGPQAALLRFSIRFRGIVAILACIVLGYGIYSLQQAKSDVFPEFAPPQAEIQTEAPGLAPEQVEVLVTQPIENNLNGVPGLRMLQSNSVQGLSVVTVTFEPSTNVYRDRQLVAERLATAAGQLPAGVEPPTVTPLTSSTSIVLVAGLTSKVHSLMDLHTIAQFTVTPRLLAVPGVAKVAVFGGKTKSIQIQVHPDALKRFGLGLEDVVAAARHATGVRGAGVIDTANQRIVLETQGQSLTPEEISRTVVKAGPAASVTLGNVATVLDAPEPQVGAGAIDGVPGVVLTISEQYKANTPEVTRRLLAAFAELQPTLAKDGVALRTDLFRPAKFIAVATGNVRNSLLLGGALVIVVLFLFLFDLRTAAISAIAIPLSLLPAVSVLHFLGITMNTMTLGGLAIAIGIVVDDAVVDIENIVRRLRENSRLAQPRPMARVVLDACYEVRSSVVYATVAVVLVAVPVLALPGIAGRLFAPLAVSYGLATVASLVVALTVTPAFAMILFGRGHSNPKDPPLLRWSRGRYETLLHGVVRRPAIILLATLVVVGAGAALIPTFGGTFLPALKEGHYTVHMTAVPGTSVAESVRLGKIATKVMLSLPEVRSVAQRVGRAELADDTNGTHHSEFEVDLNPISAEDAESAPAKIRKALSVIPGVNFAINTFLTERIEETLSGYTSPVVVNIFGNNFDLLDRKAEEVARVLQKVSGAADVQVESPPGMPQLTIKLRPRDLQRWGLTAVGVMDVIRTAYQGDQVGEVYEGNRVFPVLVILDKASRSSVSDVANLPLRSAKGVYLRLGQVADVHESSGRYRIQHQGARRLQTVTSNVSGRDVASFVADAKKAIARNVTFPSGTYVEFRGTAEAQKRAQRALLLNALIAAVGIILLLAIITRNGRNLVLVLANLPFAFVGGVAAVYLSGGVLSLGSMVGFVTLFGVTLRNSILMIAHYRDLVEIEGQPWNLETAVRGAADRLAAIVMTSLVTALGVLPLAIGMREPGREIEGPMAVVILGGLITSMALNLLVLPTLALRYGDFTRKQEDDGLSDTPAQADAGVI
ncbi:MAG: efflux RND transporter permease subunit [Beijerinckiaceae bacterium]|nr:MAG: efflux RND transporter permease subunit [Beijerinckiaceae bacterium]